MKVCIVGASGKLGRYMVQQALDRGYEVVGVYRECSVNKLDKFKRRITLIPGSSNDREGCCTPSARANTATNGPRRN